ncbi:MAG TPA: MFS transporter [Aquabacterium sp.]|uniref:MFS transporter n=1 Tax=Aquabacterium sp. TaxID=1872578 RepID=UPI002E30E94A|nr:MFS transporter [Aquabacterium sp.]HEX5355848.1 MFS transporter [Aquabacterium sp.]
MTPSLTLSHAQSARYGLLGLPLAFVAMPLYVVLPAHYAQVLGVPLGLLGGLLLLTRLMDAFVDPLIGRWIDRLLSRPQRALAWVWVMAMMLTIGFTALFFPPRSSQSALLWWCALSLLVTFGAYSFGSVLHLAWGSRLGGALIQRSRLVAWREGFGVIGVVLANVVAVQAGPGWTALVLLLTLLLGAGALVSGPRPDEAVGLASPEAAGHRTWTLPWRGQPFRRLLSLFLLNGVASAMPATLVLFFIRDRLQAPMWTAVFLASYFLMAALSVPFWLKCMARWGAARTWCAGMVLSVLSFAGVMALGAGDVLPYLLICMCSGWALGADLTAPATMLTAVLQHEGHARQAEGAYAGWWQWATKLNLALAAGLALPALQWLGYAPGETDASALLSLTMVYGAVPCVFKLMSLVLCWCWRHQRAWS